MAYLPPGNISVSGSLGSLNASVSLEPAGMAGGLIQVSGTWSGTLLAEGSTDDGATYTALGVILIGPGTVFTSITGNGTYRMLSATGWSPLRVRMSSYTSGTATVNLVATLSSPIVLPVQTVPEDLRVDISGSATNTNPFLTTSNSQYTGTPSVSSGAEVSLLNSGYDYSNQVVRPLDVDASGKLYVNQGDLSSATDSVTIGNVGNSNKLLVNSDGSINANLTASSIEIGTVDQGTGGTSAWKVDGSAVTQPVSAAALPLPTGASTSALQTTGNSSLSSIDSKIPALGQALATASVPVVLTAAQISTLTPFSTVTANAGTNLNTSALALDATLTSGSQKSKLVDSAGTNVATVSAAGALKVDGSAVTQPVSGTVTANIGTLPAITKGTQGSTGFTVQDLKDAGRTYVSLVADRATGITTENALMTLAINKNLTTSSATSYTVTSGKTLRIQAITVTIEASSTTAINGRVRLRSAASSISQTSPIVINIDVPATPGTAAAGTGQSVTVAIPDGLEFSSTQQVAFSQIVNNANSTVSVCAIGYEY